jgi:hypothetical protein
VGKCRTETEKGTRISDEECDRNRLETEAIWGSVGQKQKRGNEFQTMRQKHMETETILGCVKQKQKRGHEFWQGIRQK